ncbi:MAG: 50S ribosomal protein L11 [Candidatus Caenarcaniphilales bacterium]|jgi:large subunit ribosomal protein L11|nr:50S ribosomal protein L11 [Candidatus Caenarcaniphilales bacterium]
MAKEITGYINLQLEAGKANPAPPVGPALGQHGVNIMEFCKQYNEATKDKIGYVIPVLISVYSDRSFTFILKEPPASVLVKKKINIPKGSAVPHLEKVGKINDKQLTEVAEQKMPDLNANDINAAKKIIAGTARSMGVVVTA